MIQMEKNIPASVFISSMNSNFNDLRGQSLVQSIDENSTIADINNCFSYLANQYDADVQAIEIGKTGKAFLEKVNLNFSTVANGTELAFRDISTLTRYAENPNVPPGIAPLSPLQTSNPMVRYENKIGDTWYAPVNLTDSNYDFDTLAMMVSTDLINWSFEPTNPTIITGNTSSWDKNFLVHPDIIKIGELWHMYYSARNNAGKYQIGLATSPDMITWTKYGSTPVLSIATNCAIPSIFRIGNTYYLYYSKIDDAQIFNSVICYATSPDGLAWTDHGVIIQANAGDWYYGHGIIDPFVTLRADGIYEMIFATIYTGSYQNLGYAISRDGEAWIVKDQPILTPSNPVAWDDFELGNGLILDVPNGDSYLFYTGIISTQPYAAGGGIAIF